MPELLALNMFFLFSFPPPSPCSFLGPWGQALSVFFGAPEEKVSRDLKLQHGCRTKSPCGFLDTKV